MDRELERFFPNLNYFDSVILHVANPRLVLWRFRDLGNRTGSQCMKGSMEKGEACLRGEKA